MKMGARVAQRLSVVVMATTLGAPASAQDRLTTANFGLWGCQAITAQESAADFNKGFCAGVVASAVALNSHLPPSLKACIPQQVTLGRIIELVVTYLDTIPDRHSESFYSLVFEALRETWPCPKSN